MRQESALLSWAIQGSSQGVGQGSGLIWRPEWCRACPRPDRGCGATRGLAAGSPQTLSPHGTAPPRGSRSSASFSPEKMPHVSSRETGKDYKEVSGAQSLSGWPEAKSAGREHRTPPHDREESPGVGSGVGGGGRCRLWRGGGSPGAGLGAGEEGCPAQSPPSPQLGLQTSGKPLPTPPRGQRPLESLRKDDGDGRSARSKHMRSASRWFQGGGL